MHRINQFLLFLIIGTFLSGCELISEALDYKETTTTFVDALIKEDYNHCIGLLAVRDTTPTDEDIDNTKKSLVAFREVIVNNMGKELEYSFIRSSKKFSTEDSESTPKKTTTVQVEFRGNGYAGVLEALFDDDSKKIINIKTLDIKTPIQPMIYFWMFGLLAICVPILNIYVIVKIKRSNLKRKWLKYLAVICLNVPSFTYTAVNGLSFSLLSIQLLFGLSFASMGVLNSYWTVGIPLGGLYWLWKLNRKKEEVVVAEAPMLETTGDDVILDNDPTA